MSREPSRAELMGLTEAHSNGASRVTHRGILALHTGAVEAQGRNPLLGVLDVQDAFVASLSRLRLWEVLGLQSDGLDHLYWNQDLVHSQQLGAVLGTQGMAQFGHVGNQKDSNCYKPYIDVGLCYGLSPEDCMPILRQQGRSKGKKSQILVLPF